MGGPSGPPMTLLNLILLHLLHNLIQVHCSILTLLEHFTYSTPPLKDYLDSKQIEENRVWPIFLFDLACAKSIILANSVGNPQRNGHFKCLFYEKNIKISIRYEVFGSFHSKYKIIPL